VGIGGYKSYTNFTSFPKAVSVGIGGYKSYTNFTSFKVSTLLIPPIPTDTALGEEVKLVEQRIKIGYVLSKNMPLC
jgi:hypothetical protein